MTVGLDIVLIVGAIALALIALAALPDMGRTLGKYSHYIFFFVSLIVCMFVVGRYGSGNVPVSIPTANVAAVIDGTSREQKIKMGISECQAFVEAKRRGEAHPSEIEPASGGFLPITMQSASMWETCAERFGESFWKVDTTIDGRRGGDVLCDLYRQGDYRSERVDMWCSTVFAPKSQAE